MAEFTSATDTCHNQGVSSAEPEKRRGDEYRAKRAAVNSLASAFGVIGVLLIALVTTPVALHRLGLVLFGVWGLAISTIGYFSFLDPGFSGMVVRYGARGRVEGDHDIAARITTLGTVAWLLIGLALAPIVFVLVHFTIPHLAYSHGVKVATEKFIYWFYGLVVVSAVQAILSARLVAVGEQWIVTLIDVGSRVVYGVLFVVLLSTGWQLSSIVIATSTQYVIAFSVTLLMISLRHGKPYASPRRIPKDVRAELRRFSGWFQLNAILETLTYETDPIVITALVSPVASGLFSLAQRAARQVTYIGFIPNANILPSVSAAVAAGESHADLARMYARANRVVVLISVTMAGLVMAFSTIYLKAWTGRDFPHLATAMVLIVLSMVAGTPRPATAAAIFALGKVGVGVRAQAIAFAVNVVLTLALVQPFGLNGVLIGTLAAKLFASTYLLATFRRLIDQPAATLYWSWMIPAAAVLVPCTIGGRLFADHWSWATQTHAHAVVATFVCTALFGIVELALLKMSKYFSRADALWLRDAMPAPLRRLVPDRAVHWIGSPS